MKLDTIDVKGKSYVMVNTRIKAFRELPEYKGYSLETDIIKLDDIECVIKAIIRDDKGVVKANGTAQETKNASMINKTSFVENCETSAWGRALGNLGIGVDDSIASAEEVLNAIAQQTASTEYTPKSAPQSTKPQSAENNPPVYETAVKKAQDDFDSLKTALNFGVQGRNGVKRFCEMTTTEREACLKTNNATVQEMALRVENGIASGKVVVNDDTGLLEVVPF